MLRSRSTLAGAVTAPESEYTRGQKNKDFFNRRNAQLAWALRLRALNTQRLANGEDVPPELCMFINPDIKNLEVFLAQLTQPEWEEDMSGRIKVEKVPEEELASPDMYDAAVLSYCNDSRFGLRLATMTMP